MKGTRKKRWIYQLSLFGILLISVSTFGRDTVKINSEESSKKNEGLITGKLFTEEKEPIDFATIYLKGTHYGCTSDERGNFRLTAPSGQYTLVISAIGFKTVEKTLDLINGKHLNFEMLLNTDCIALEEVVVTSSGVERVKKSAFNAVAVDTKELMNSTKNLSEALMKLPGMKLRESGGVGSELQLMLDGFSGKHVKVFIDGVPQEGTGLTFNLNNIPVNFADRIEVYKGVVPVEFGSDALGGVVNIVTNKSRRHWFLDTSYSYGSFNTHKSYANFGQTLKNGLTYELNAFQNYSDNDYFVNNWVREFEVQEDGSIRFPPIDKTDIRQVKRFNDRYHNESVIGKLGVVDKLWADRLLLSFTYSNFYKEIQTGVYQETVFGEKHRKGYSLMPSLEYRKRNLFVKDLDLNLTANYNHTITHNIDTSSLAYNWAGMSYNKGSKGEQSYQRSESVNGNWNATMNINYRIGTRHTFTLNHVFSSFERTSRRTEGAESVLTDFDIPKITRKNISGLSYRFLPSDKWNVSVFGKYYNQYNKGPVSTSVDGVGNYMNLSKKVSAWGYGTAGTYYILRGLQAKLSYEKAYRLPTNDELFGDEDLEAGKTDLKPENSHNFNFNLNYSHRINQHSFYLEGSLIYRDTKDYIKRGIGKHGALEYGVYENHGHVKTKGYHISLRYNYSHWFNVGGTFNSIDTRDYERYVAGGTQQESMHYKVRLPNIPYRFANVDATFSWKNLFAKDNHLNVTYDSFWQHEFPLYWENIGDSESKAKVPDQFSHTISLTYSIKNGKYNFSFECRNLTNEKLYDNFSLQKPGRAFYCKLRVYLDGKKQNNKF
ncbi:MAG: TonB-dependent receptor [Parabacteroides distasonis]|nr:TonB-dependent receptor [Parabacteroides distasonis]